VRNWGSFGRVWAKRRNSRRHRRLGSDSRKGKKVPVLVSNTSIDASLVVNDKGLGRMIWGAERRATATNVSTRAVRVSTGVGVLVIPIRLRVLEGLDRAVDGRLGRGLGLCHLVKRSL